MGGEPRAVASAAVALVLAAAAALAALCAPRVRLPLARAGFALAVLAALLPAGALAARWIGADAFPLNGRYDSILLMIVGVAAGSAGLLRSPAFPSGDDRASAAALLASAPACFLGAALAAFALGQDTEPLYASPAVRSLLAGSHYALRAIGTGLFFAGAAAALARACDRVPAAADDASWDRVLRGTVVLGLPPYLVAVLLGAVWHQEIWATPWQWDVVETWPLGVVLWHVAWLHLRFAGAAGTRLSALLLAAGGLLAGGLFLLHDLPAAVDSQEVYAGF